MVPLAGKAIALRYKVSLLAPLCVVFPLAGKAVAFRYKASLFAPLRMMVREAGCLSSDTKTASVLLSV